MAEQSISDLLADPDAMNGILSLVRELTSELAPQTQQSTGSEPPETAGGFSLAGIDPKYIRIAVAVMDAWNDPQDEKQVLLKALAPYLSDARSAQIDRAVQISRLARVIRTAYDSIKEEQRNV